MLQQIHITQTYTKTQEQDNNETSTIIKLKGMVIGTDVFWINF